VQYPVLFGQGDNQYPAMLALEDIEKNETIIKVPSREIINTKKAFYSELEEMFYEHPELFSKTLNDGEDMILHSFILHEIQKGKDSIYHQMIKMWPKDTDIVMNWEEEDLDYLQDPTLKYEAERQYNEMMDSWNRLYAVLSKYPKQFKAESISFYRFKWVFILTTNRCFSSNWPGVCQMVPWCDQINHENVNVNYDCLDAKTGERLMTWDEKLEVQRQEELKKEDSKGRFLTDLKNDLQELSNQFDKTTGQIIQVGSGPNEHNTIRIQTDKNKIVKKGDKGEELDKKDIDERTNKLRDTLINERREKNIAAENKEDSSDYSSGIESDNDLDLLVE